MAVKLLFLAGSCRQGSMNMKLAQAACALAADKGADAQFIDLADYDMPLYNQDLEDAEGLPAAAIALKKLFIECDGFFIASPEYNSGMSPLLSNVLTWISRKGKAEDEAILAAYSGKVAALSAASPGGYGGLRGLVPLRMMLGNIKVHIIPEQLALGSAHEHFDGDGGLKTAQYQKMLDGVVSSLVNATKSLKDT